MKAHVRMIADESRFQCADLFLYTARTMAPTPSVPTLPFASMTDEQVREALRQYQIGLTVDEARKVQEMLGRAPTAVEAVIWGIQGSEHCSYKSSRRFLKLLPTQGKHVILGPKEDSGIVALTDGPKGKRWGIVISHESHNHPSQIVPFEGAATGVGGTVRDVVCMGARVVGCMDLLRLGDLQTNESKTIAKEVVRGIAGYGNPLGIPNVGGDTVFDSSYNSNCLVNAIALGIVREDEVIHSFVPEEAAKVGYDIILVGKPTDRSGFGGASFASATMEEDKREQNSGAVQEPNPFLERHLLASTYALFDWLVANNELHHVSFKDLGAGGVVCASVEQVAPLEFGAEVDLDKVHVSMQSLPAEVIACAETQERFCWMCHPSLTAHILKHYNQDWDLPRIAEKAGASVIGKVTGDGIYRVYHQGKIVCEAKSTDITSGLLYNRPTASSDTPHVEPDILSKGATIEVKHEGTTFTTTMTDVFKALLRHPNHASKFPAILHYDKTVIGNSVIEAGEADAGVLQPLQDLEHYVQGGTHPGWELSDLDKKSGAAFAGDGNGRYGRISAYWQGANATTESMCNVAAVGATPRALTDCLNYGNPEVPSQLGALEEGVKGIADAANGVAVDGAAVPIISGNVSLYNDTADGGAIPPTAIVCCIGVIRDAAKAVTMQLKNSGSVIAYLGNVRDECGGSAYYEVLEKMMGLPYDALLGANVPKSDFKLVGGMIECVTNLIDKSLILSCHDVSDGGVLFAAFEMTLPQRKMGGAIGLDVDLSVLSKELPPAVLAFSQSTGFLLEVDVAKWDEVVKFASSRSIPLQRLGMTTPEGELCVRHGSDLLVKEKNSVLRTEWEQGLSHAWKAVS
jgi:phosphoribosylformylglycinamidine synthase